MKRGNSYTGILNYIWNFSIYSEPHSQNRLCETFLLLMFGFSPYRFIKIAFCEQAPTAIYYKSTWLWIDTNFNSISVPQLPINCKTYDRKRQVEKHVLPNGKSGYEEKVESCNKKFWMNKTPAIFVKNTNNSSHNCK